MRSILHVNIVHFHAAVAAVADPALRGRPVVVRTPGTGTRGGVVALSHEAWRQGVRRGMGLDAAVRRCPDLIIAPARPRFSERVERAVLSLARRVSPVVEPAGPGHLFIDLSGTGRLWGSGIDVAASLRTCIHEQTGLEAVVGVSTSKLVSKVATRVIKPLGICDIVHGCEASFLAPLPVTMLPAADSETLSAIQQFNISTINELCLLGERRLAEVFGEEARWLLQSARGIDTAPVRCCHAPSPVEVGEQLLAQQTNCDTVVWCALRELVATLGYRLRRSARAAGSIRLQVTYGDGVDTTARYLPPFAVNSDRLLFGMVQRLYRERVRRRVRISGVRIELGDLSPPYTQLDLFDAESREQHLMHALDLLREKFGAGVAQMGERPLYAVRRRTLYR